ncbi:MAG: twin-arginine translocation signal domain-containing protein [Candidatus Nanohaloarchaea archaeon]|nr:twin-arginine translocation signal domain-containing protein [Candidatus Nanohaloarchaea archaeon]
MLEQDDLSRRDFLKLGGAAAVLGPSLAVGKEYASKYMEQFENSLPMEVNVYQTPDVAETAAAYGRDEHHAQDVAAAYIQDAFNEVFDRTGIDAEVHVNVVDEPVDMGDHDTTEGMLKDWYDELATREDTASHSNLLIHGNHYMDALGEGESGWDGPLGHVHSCGTSSEVSNGAVLGNGYRLIELDPETVNETTAWKLYAEDLDETIYPGHPPAEWVAYSAAHEVGHNSCLHHDMGDVTVEDQEHGRELTASVMMGAYYDEFADETNGGSRVPEPEENDDIYLSNRFSETVEQFLAETYGQ